MSDSSLLNNRYQLEKRLGTGGMAVVFSARDLMLERTVAVKILRETYSSDPDFRQRFHQEAKAAANLSHPNIVTIHDFGLDAGRLFIVMEFVPGTDLKTMQQARGRFSVDEALNLIIQACAGIGYAHRAGLVHCDVKPHNILITPDQRVKVTDFGIARALVSINPDEQSEIVWGSPQYFAPEQAAGKPPSPASDVYSLGVVLYQMLTGRLPFSASTAEELARLHRDVPPTPPRQINPAIPETLDQIILKVLSKEPSARYRTADQLGRVLININRHPEPTVHPEATRQQGRVTSDAPASSKPNLSSTGSLHRAQTGPIQPPPIQRVRPVIQLQEEEEESAVQTDMPRSSSLDIDWVTTGLLFLALLAVGGLIPLWVLVYRLYNFP
jgi:serine/threonine protein kinase